MPNHAQQSQDNQAATRGQMLRGVHEYLDHGECAGTVPGEQLVLDC